VPIVQRITKEAQAAEQLRAQLLARLPAELAPHVSGVSEKAGMVVVWAESAAWSARLRFAVAELAAELSAAHPRLGALAVRVRPRR
jgi:hypothetical protein